MHPARKRTRQSSQEMGSCLAGSMAVGVVNTAAAECPICMNEFGAGPRTKVHPFHCVGIEKHAICRACDSTLYRRHDDRCPTCRAERDVATSDARHGGRSSGTPVHLRNSDQISLADVAGLAVAAAAAATMFFPIDNSYNVVSGPSISIFHTAEGDPANTTGELHVLEDHSDGELGGVALTPDVLHRAAAAMHGDPRMTAALEGLRDVPSVPLEAFMSRAHHSVTDPAHPVMTRRRSRGSFHRRV